MGTHPAITPPLGGTDGDLRGRILRFHLPLAFASSLVLVLFTTFPAFDVTRFQSVDTSGRLPRLSTAHEEHDESSHATMTPLTVSTGYCAVGLLGLTLLLGPANMVLGRQNPISSYLRRDVGIWAAAMSVAHLALAVLAHAGGGIVAGFLHFFVDDGRVLTNAYGLGNWAGLAALAILTLLLAISSDAALRALKPRPWKWLQRLNYAVFAFAVLHAFFYGALLRTTSPFTLLLVLTVIAVFTGQAAGVLLRRSGSEEEIRK